MERDELLKKIKYQESENEYIEFKEKIDFNNKRESIEIIKDIIAISNSGGGSIIIGVDDYGNIINNNIVTDKLIDPAILTDKIKKYTNIQFSKFEFIKIERKSLKLNCIIIEATECPIIFENPGTYELENKKQKTAFGRGTIYFRHGAKSEPATNSDIINVVENEIDRRRKKWLGNIRKVVEAPADNVVYTLPQEVKESDNPNATEIRITDSDDAPEYRITNPDKICPNRQKNIIKMVNQSLDGKCAINQYDILSIVKVYKINNNKPQYFYQSKYGPKQYSKKFVDWIVEEYKKNNGFFIETRKKYKKLKRIEKKGI